MFLSLLKDGYLNSCTQDISLESETQAGKKYFSGRRCYFNQINSLSSQRILYSDFSVDYRSVWSQKESGSTPESSGEKPAITVYMGTADREE